MSKRIRESILMEWWFFLNNHRWGIGNTTFKLWYIVAMLLALLITIAAFVLWKPLLSVIVIVPIVVIVTNRLRDVWARLHRVYEVEVEDVHR